MRVRAVFLIRCPPLVRQGPRLGRGAVDLRHDEAIIVRAGAPGEANPRLAAHDAPAVRPWPWWTTRSQPGGRWLGGRHRHRPRSLLRRISAASAVRPDFVPISAHRAPRCPRPARIFVRRPVGNEAQPRAFLCGNFGKRGNSHERYHLPCRLDRDHHVHPLLPRSPLNHAFGGLSLRNAVLRSHVKGLDHDYH